MSAKNDDVRPLLDAWLDGALAPEDERRLEQVLVESESFRGWLREDLELSEGLRQVLGLTEGSPRGELERVRRMIRRWRAAALVAASALLALGLTWLLLPGDRSGADAAPGPYEPGPGSLLEAGGPGPDWVRLERGSLQVNSSEAPARVHLPDASVAVSGRAGLFRPAGAGYTLLGVHEGRARVRTRDVEELVLPEDGPVVVESRGTLPLGEVLATYRDGVGPEDGGLDEPGLYGEDGGDPRLRIAELVRENRQLNLELKVLKRRAGGEAAPSIRELVEAAEAEFREREGFDRSFYRAVRSRALTLVRMARGEQDELLEAVRDLVLVPGAEPEKLVFGLRVLQYLGSCRSCDDDDRKVLGAKVLEDVCGFLEHPHRKVRMSAVETLARRGGSERRKLLERTFRKESEDLMVRAVAAGGLLRQGYLQREAFNWLQDAYKNPSLTEDERGRIVSRIVHAPVARLGPFVLENAGLLEPRQLRYLVHLLGRFGGDSAVRTLEQLASRVQDDDLRSEIAETLSSLRGF